MGKVTPGVTGWSGANVHSDPPVCCSAVGSPHPGRAAAAKGRPVRPLKGIVSWVQSVARQLGLLLSGPLPPEGSGALVRKEQAPAANGDRPFDRAAGQPRRKG